MNPNRKRAYLIANGDAVRVLLDKFLHFRSDDDADTIFLHGVGLACKAKVVMATPVNYRDVLDMTMMGGDDMTAF